MNPPPQAAAARAPDSIDIADVQPAELDLIFGRSDDTRRPPGEPTLWGLALSGGGIRSATFGLGVLQALARSELLRCFHYQSTVSGGGYIGAFLQGLIHRHGFDEAFAVLATHLSDATAGSDTALNRQRPIRHLREYSNYLSPRKSLFSGDALGMMGTYVRNVLLIQVQLFALLLALSLLPLLVYRYIATPAQANPTVSLTIAGLLCVMASLLLGWITRHASRASAGGLPMAPGPVAAAALAVIAALSLASFVGAAGLAALKALPQPLQDFSVALLPQATLAQRLALATGILYFLAWLIWLGLDWLLARADGDPAQSPMQQHRGRFVFGSFCGAVVAGLMIIAAHRLLQGWDGSGAELWHAMILGPPVVLGAVTLTGIAHLGLAGPALNDLQREIWARVGGRTAGMVLLGITLPLSLTIYGPWLLIVLSTDGWSLLTASAGVLSWIATTGTGLFAAYGARSGGRNKSGTLERLVRLAPAVFVLGLLVAVSLAAQHLLLHTGSLFDGSHWPPRPDFATIKGSSFDPYLDYLGANAATLYGTVGLVVALALFVWLLFGVFVNVNEFSMNAFYRNRLLRCYLGASNSQRQAEPITNFDPRDDIKLADVVADKRYKDTRPLFPLVGTALNLVASRQLDWQDRKAASFCLTPLHCGYIPPASRRGNPGIGDAAPGTAQETSRVADTLSLGSAMAISGAAVSPNMGYHSSPAVTFLLTLFDARLGWWLANPSDKSRPAADSTPFSLLRLIREMLGLTRDNDRYVYLSDGGHFENLGLYELVRRRCRFVLCVDAGADRARNFTDLGNAVQKCRVDFGVDIRIDLSALRPGAYGRVARYCAVGDIFYPDRSRGVLLYLKPGLTGAEPTDITNYASSHPGFPHESTADQYFDEKQFESYRRLGDVAGEAALDAALERALGKNARLRRSDLDLHDSALKESFLLELKHQWVPPLAGVRGNFAIHGKSMSQLFEKMRTTPELAILDAQIYPAWTDLVPPATADARLAPLERPLARRTRLPSSRDFRVCFYFCQELLQLMEAVYHDLDLENSREHPDNRGWMNMFRHWSWSPMFRIAWGASSPTYGTRFVTFCETRLGLPSLDTSVQVVEQKPAAGMGWAQFCNTLADDGIINHVEHGILVADILGAATNTQGRLFVLRLRWDRILVRTRQAPRDTTLGIAYINGNTLHVLRIQDHLRKLGLGAEFMRLLRAQVKFGGVEVRHGHYGPVGVCTGNSAQAFTVYLKRLLVQANQRLGARQPPRNPG